MHRIITRTGSVVSRGRRPPPSPESPPLFVGTRTNHRNPSEKLTPRSRSGRAVSPKSTECSDYEAGSAPSPSPPTPPSREARADRFGERNGGARISSEPASERHPKVEERNVTPVPGEFFLRAVTAFFAPETTIQIGLSFHVFSIH